MSVGPRRIAIAAIAAIIATTAAVPGPAFANSGICSDPSRVSAWELDRCIGELRLESEAAARHAQKANERYLIAKQDVEQAEGMLRLNERGADSAQFKADRSRARAAVTAAHLARSGGSAGPTAELLLSGEDGDSLLYHLTRMSELSANTSDLAADAARDSAAAEDARQRADLTAEQLAVKQRVLEDRYAEATETAEDAQKLVVRAEKRRAKEAGIRLSKSSAHAGVVLPADASVAQRVLAYARSQFGEPYVLGGAGPTTWDCSGLTMQSFAANGISIGGHGATVQYTTARDRGLLVPYSAAQPGDLIFWTDGDGSMYHVAIYSGGGNMIEAPMPGRVVREVPVRPDQLIGEVARFTN